MDTKEDVTQVSLPGAGGTEPTIIEVLNRNIAGGDSTGASASGSTTGGDPAVPEENTDVAPVTTDINKSDNSKPIEGTNSNHNHNKESVAIEEEKKRTEASDSVDNVNVLEIESHLIESSELSDTSGVKVEEVPPATEELSKPSTIESETSPKTVIEVEPSTPKLLKPLEFEVCVNKQESKLSFTNNPTTEATIKLLEEEKQESSSHIESLQRNNSKQNSKPDESTNKVLVEGEEDTTSTSDSVSTSEKTSLDSPSILPEIENYKNNTNTNEQITVNSNKETPLETLKNIDLSKESSTISNAKQEIKKQVKEEVSPENHQPINTNLTDVIEEVSESNQAEINSKEEPQPNNNPELESKPHLGINGFPVTTSKAEEEAKKNFLDSIPQLNETDTASLSIQAKKERYQLLRDYLHQEEFPPPVPLQTYRWEDLRRAKQQGGYPWTHLYKRPLGPDEEPEIVLLLRKSQELQQLTESPRSLKKVRIHDQVLVKETERYINDLADTEDLTEEETKSCQSISDSASFTASESEEKKSKGSKLRGILKRNRSDKTDPSPKPSKAGKSEVSPKKSKCCHPFMDKLRNMADKQLKKRNIKKVPLKGKDKIILAEDQKILKLKQSPKAERSEIPHFIEKQDSDEVVEIVELEESPSKARKRRELLAAGQHDSSVLVPDEIIELPLTVKTDEKIKPEDGSQPTPEPTVSEILEEEMKSSPPPKAPRKRKEHVYEDIDDKEIEENIDKILEEAVVGALKKSLAAQDHTVMQDLDVKKLEEMGSSAEEEPEKPTMSHLAPISSIDSTSSDEERKVQLPALAEESDQGSTDLTLTETETDITVLKIVEDHEKDAELRSVLKREPSPSVDKKVTFSHVEDEAEPHREDIELPEQFRNEGRWSKMSDHEYEPIGEPVEDSKPKTKPVAEEPKPKPISEPKPSPPPQKEKSPTPQSIPTFNVSEPMEVDNEDVAAAPRAASVSPPQPEEPIQKFSEDEITAQEQEQEEDHFFPSATTTPRSESRTDHEIHTSQVDSSALEELPLKRENRKKGFMASAQDTSRRMQANLRSQAGKIRTKIRGMKKQPSGSPKAKDRKRFKGPDFSKIKMPDIKRPELPKFKTPDFKKMEFKRPEFTKFQKPDMSKFKIPDRFSSLRVKRSKSLKESDMTQETTSATTFESGTTPVKKRFEFNFSTYPRALGRKKKKELGAQVIARASDLPSTDTAPTSPESSTIPRGPRDQGPVGSRWADKFSEFSSVDSESGKYQRYGSEPESYERESSLERRMKDDIEQTSQDEPEQETLQTDEQKQFAEYDEENRAIHQISKTRAKEFKQRRPMVHQDSDVVSEEGKDVGWTDKDILRNKILRRDESEQEPENYPSEEGLTGSMTNTNQETQSTGSSGILRQKGVIEEIDDDEFFLRKRGISQDNIEIRQYISSAIREGFDTPMNALAQLGDSQTYYPDQFNSDMSSEQMNYGYDVPPPKPRRAKHYQYDQRGDSAEISQEFEMEHKDGYEDNISLPHTGSDYFKNFPPTRPLRKPRKQYSEDSQEVPESDAPYFEEDDDRLLYKRDEELNDLSGHPQITFSYHETGEFETQKTEAPPQAPKRRRKQLRESVERDEKDSYINGFGGRSISNSYLPNDNQMEEVVVYRTEHEYSIPLAKEETFTSPTPTPRSRRSTSRSRNTDDDRTSHGADSMILDSQPSHEEDKFHIEMKENDGYAVVRKEPPPRPPPPTRRKRSPHPMGESQFATMPHLRNGDEPPARPKRNYSTIGPSRPPRRKSSTGIGETHQDVILPEYSPYEELDIEDIEERTESPRDLQSGDIINKMKYRPLPPPPRPPREHRRYKDTGDKFDKDGGGEKIEMDYDENGDYEIDKGVEKCIEVEVSTQTDPLPDDFVCEEFEITDDMKIIEPRRPKTLEDILKEEQEAEIERARQLAEEENFTRSIQRFRESSQRSYSERSKGSTAGRSRSHSRPTTPSAVVIEKRMPTPIPHRANESMLEASLIVRPLDDYDYEDELEAELRRTEDKLEAQTAQSDLSSQKQEEEERLITDYTRDIRDISSTEKEESIPESDIRTEDETDPEAEYERENFQKVYEGKLRLDLDAELRLKLESIEPESEPEAETTLIDEVPIEPEVKIEQEMNLEAAVEPEYIPKVEIKIEHKFEESTEAKVEPQPEPKTEAVSQPKAEVVSEPKAEVLPETKTEALPESKAEVLPEPKPEPLPEPKPEPLPEPKPEVLPEPKPEVQAEPKAKAEPKPKPIPVPDPELEIDLELEVDIPPPQPPPRRRSYAQPAEETSVVSTEFSPESSITPIAEQPTQAVAPTRLAIADLEVERLNVHALQAGRIMVSELQGASIMADDLECKSGSLNVRNLQFPPGFIEEIIERVRNIEREHLQAVQSVPAETQTVEAEESKPPVPSPPQTQSPVSEPPPVPEQPPVRPPPPQPIFPSEYLQYSMPPPAFYQLRDPSEEEHQHSVQMHRRRRHHRRRDSSSEEDSYRERRRSRQGTRSPEPTVGQLGSQLLRACGNSVARSMNQIANYLQTTQKEGNERNISTAIVLLILMALGILIIGMSGKTIHHHHWDFFNPPGNSNQ